MNNVLQERYACYEWHLDGFAPSGARRAVEEILFFWEVEREGVGDAMLITSEVVTNAVRHVHPELRRTGFLHVAIVLAAGTLRFEISDPDPRPPRLVHATDDDECHRGMTIVDALAREWGCQPAPVGFGKVVWWTQSVALAR
ncbi:hypothetical protein Misp01_08400 [Microtetraspora sp. NBRC 13810]|uniref:ATP-binding protein n=1 Tax=Microtetraspora sp. NBRC 13810 TaxID=3030990 RepID=UPI0024A5CE1D|nr:ATP-binding protein [Microtetraspora sp. NBRC 13810]GLW05710.1 hypothetical protein Misp01_08400 [Microtetraspora sp. NBRC 13810]